MTTADDITYAPTGTSALPGSVTDVREALDDLDLDVYHLQNPTFTPGSPATPPALGAGSFTYALGCAGKLTVAGATGDTTLTSDGFKTLPAIGGLIAPLKIVLWRADGLDTLEQIEVCYVTAHDADADTVTVTRAQESTAAAAWDIGDRWANALTPQDISDIYTATGGGGTSDPWQDVAAFTNSWVASGVSGYPDPGYFVDSGGMVHLRGLMKDGDAGAVAFTLPDGYRPEFKQQFVGTCDAGASHLYFAEVQPSGDVYIANYTAGDNVDLSSISFRSYTAVVVSLLPYSTDFDTTPVAYTPGSITGQDDWVQAFENGTGSQVVGPGSVVGDNVNDSSCLHDAGQTFDVKVTATFAGSDTGQSLVLCATADGSTHLSVNVWTDHVPQLQVYSGGVAGATVDMVGSDAGAGVVSASIDSAGNVTAYDSAGTVVGTYTLGSTDLANLAFAGGTYVGFTDYNQTITAFSAETL